jgi:hypothetical protein
MPGPHCTGIGLGHFTWFAAERHEGDDLPTRCVLFTQSVEELIREVDGIPIKLTAKLAGDLLRYAARGLIL